MNTAKTLVTGGTGFLGGALVQALCEKGDRVRVLDNNFRGRTERLADVENDVELVEADIRDRAAVESAVAGCDLVYHLASINGTRHFYERPDLVLGVGVEGTLNIIHACERHGVERLLFASSSEVYCEPTQIPTPEDEEARIPDVLNPRYSYAGAKLIGELMTLHMLRDADTEPVIFRPHNIYGPQMGVDHVIPEFIVRMIERTNDGNSPIEFPIQGDGSQTRSFCYVDDAVAGVILAAEKGLPRTIYHVGVDDEISIADLARLVADVVGVEIRIAQGPLPEGGTPRRCPDISRLRGLGYCPSYSLREGLRRTVDWHNNQHDSKKRTAACA
jgi:nucleoside-diphosphate-sugar epimerase